MTAPTWIPQRPYGRICDGCLIRFCLANELSARWPRRLTDPASGSYSHNAAEFTLRRNPIHQPHIVAQPNGLAEAA